jgi:hypothetical protein
MTQTQILTLEVKKIIGLEKGGNFMILTQKVRKIIGLEK